MTTYNKLANTAEDMATHDMGTSVRQALPDWVPGRKPTLDEYQGTLATARNPQPGNNRGTNWRDGQNKKDE